MNKPGDKVGKWVIQQKLGSGSMGTVYKAHDERVESQVRALKFVNPKLASDTSFRQRFFREFEVLESLRHPNILLVYDYFEEGGTLVLINEYLEGLTLKEELAFEGYTLPWQRVYDWTMQALYALDFAHCKGIIHRDIKPSNLFKCKDGSLKVIDFGLAKKLGDVNVSLTNSGQILGTPAYLAPEIAEMQPNAASDLYSLGITMYQLLSGRLPFDTSDSKGDQVMAMIVAHATKTPKSLREMDLEIPDPMVETIEKVLNKDPGKRYASAAEMAEALYAVNDEAEQTQEDCATGGQSAGSMAKNPIWWQTSTPIPERKSSKHNEAAHDDGAMEDTLVVETPVPAEKFDMEDVAWPSRPIRILRFLGILFILLLGGALAAFVLQTKGVELPFNFSISRAEKPAPAVDIPLEMVRIDPGTFKMGSRDSEPGRLGDEKQHQVTITRPYMIAKTEITQGVWKQVMKGNPSRFSECGDDCPVDTVSWYEATDFCNKLSILKGLRPCYSVDAEVINWDRNCNGYRLPTEAEWEYAARAGTSTPFSSGQCLTTQAANFNGKFPQKGCKKGEAKKEIMKVASFKPNPWGLYDMNGNLMEWVWDWKNDYPSGSVSDPMGPYFGSDRVLRGGSYRNGARNCRSAARHSGPPRQGFSTLGLRPAQSISK